MVPTPVPGVFPLYTFLGTGGPVPGLSDRSKPTVGTPTLLQKTGLDEGSARALCRRTRTRHPPVHSRPVCPVHSSEDPSLGSQSVDSPTWETRPRHRLGGPYRGGRTWCLSGESSLFLLLSVSCRPGPPFSGKENGVGDRRRPPL